MDLQRQISSLSTEQYKEQYPLCEKTTYSFITIMYCFGSIHLLAKYCQAQETDCFYTSRFTNILIVVLWIALATRVLTILMLMLSFLSKTTLITTIIFEQKLLEAEFFTTMLGVTFGVIAYILSENCNQMQTVYGILICGTYILLRLMCLPNGYYNYFEGEYI